MEVELTGTHKCGHTWTHLFPFEISAQVLQTYERRFREDVCKDCKRNNDVNYKE